jgi:hypothetical protein
VLAKRLGIHIAIVIESNNMIGIKTNQGEKENQNPDLLEKNILRLLWA